MPMVKTPEGCARRLTEFLSVPRRRGWPQKGRGALLRRAAREILCGLFLHIQKTRPEVTTCGRMAQAGADLLAGDYSALVDLFAREGLPGGTFLVLNESTKYLAAAQAACARRCSLEAARPARSRGYIRREHTRRAYVRRGYCQRYWIGPRTSDARTLTVKWIPPRAVRSVAVRSCQVRLRGAADNGGTQ